MTYKLSSYFPWNLQVKQIPQRIIKCDIYEQLTFFQPPPFPKFVPAFAPDKALYGYTVVYVSIATIVDWNKKKKTISS